jgi:hypothetical protein
VREHTSQEKQIQVTRKVFAYMTQRIQKNKYTKCAYCISVIHSITVGTKPTIMNVLQMLAKRFTATPTDNLVSHFPKTTIINESVKDHGCVKKRKNERVEKLK